MFEVGASTSFRAFHRMPEQPPPENELHPHDYRVEVVAERERLDERGMVCDLDVVTGSLADVADRRARPRPVGGLRDRGRHGRGPRRVDPRSPRRTARRRRGRGRLGSGLGVRRRVRGDPCARLTSASERAHLRLSPADARRSGPTDGRVPLPPHDGRGRAGPPGRDPVRARSPRSPGRCRRCRRPARSARRPRARTRSCSTASRRRSPRRGSDGSAHPSSRSSISRPAAWATAGCAGRAAQARRPRLPFGGRDRRRGREPRRRPVRESACRPTGSSSSRPGATSPIASGPPLDLRRGRGASVLCVANWTPLKGILELVNAFATLPRGGRDAVAGRGHRRRSPVREARPPTDRGARPRRPRRRARLRSGRGGRPALPIGRRVRALLVRRRVRHGVGRGDRGGPPGRRLARRQPPAARRTRSRGAHGRPRRPRRPRVGAPSDHHGPASPRARSPRVPDAAPRRCPRGARRRTGSSRRCASSCVSGVETP